MLEIVVIVVILILIMLLRRSDNGSVSVVTLYSSKDCPLCRDLKSDIWPKLIDEFPNIEFKNIDCFDKKEEALNAGITAFPTAIITRNSDYKYSGAWTYKALYIELSK